MPSCINPAGFLADLMEVFDGGRLQADGLTFDRELCLAMFDGLYEAAESFRIPLQLAEDVGLLDRLRLAAEPAPRTPIERQMLAAMAIPLDPEGRVVAFPVGPVPVPSLSSEGPAA